MVHPLDRPTHELRAQQHAHVGDALCDATGEEWAAVCWFYSAYHLVKGALLVDPVFDDIEWCRRRDPDLLPEDRLTSRHKGRRHTSAGREFGINELVTILYPRLAGLYDRLHQASIDVRYQRGLRGSTQQIRDCYLEFVRRVQDEGALSSVPAVDDVPPAAT